MNADTSTINQASPASGKFGRYVPLACWVVVVLTFIIIALKITGYGYVPGGDARRHAARVLTDKPYTEILVLRPEYKMNHSPGWEWLLRTLHQSLGWNEDALINFSIVFLLLLLFIVPLFWLRRPEAWLAALLAEMVAIPELMTRFTQARPYQLTEAALMGILLAWSTPDSKYPSRLKLGLTFAAITLSVWMHGAWYLWILPVAAFYLAGWCRAGTSLAVCWLVGAVTGAILTGHPFIFLQQAVSILTTISRENAPPWLLVGEFQPSYGEYSTLLLLAAVYLWRARKEKIESRFALHPVICLMIIAWILGFKADRFWADWGIPAVLIWLAVQFEEVMESAWSILSGKRLLVCVLLAVPLFWHSTNDLGRRYTHCLDEATLDANDPNLAGWMPESNGIFYSAQMEFFYNTFYKNPQADWRYIVGFEPALMPEEDLRIYRAIQRTQGAPKAYEPWIAKMHPQDRLAISSPTQPDLPQLEWHYATGSIWIGRLPGRK